MINGEQPRSGWWQESDDGWYLPDSYPQPGAVRAAPEPRNAVAAGPRHAVPGMRSDRYGRRWMWSALGVVTALAGVAAVGAGIVVVVNSNSVHIRRSAPAHHISGAVAAFATQDQIETTAVTPAQLRDALLPARKLGSGAAVTGPDTSLSHNTGNCGEPAPGGFRAMASESLRDSQTGRSLRETIIDWANPADAGRSLRLDREAAEQAGSCHASSAGVRESVIIRRSGSPAVPCGRYLAVRAPGGFRVMAACGSVTVAIQVQAKRRPDVSQASADGYLKAAVSRLTASWLRDPRLLPAGELSAPVTGRGTGR
jgi:hypothetical protein